MKKILSLLALVMLSCMGAWAATTTKDVVASTNETTPEHPFYVIGTSNGYYWNSTTGPTQNFANIAVFAFYAVDGAENQYYIKNVTTNQWLKYTTAASYSATVSFVDFDSNKGNASKFHFAKTTNKTASTPCYEICPIKENGTKASIYLNWYGGVAGNGTYSVDDTRSVGVYSTNAPGDAGSGWSLVSAELDYVKIGTGKYYMSTTNGTSANNIFHGSSANTSANDYQYYGCYTDPSTLPAGLDGVCFTITRSNGGALYTIYDNRAESLVAYDNTKTTMSAHDTRTVRPLINVAEADLGKYEGNTNWIFQSKAIGDHHGFTVGPQLNNANVNWNKHTDYLGMWGGYNDASVVKFIPADIASLNALLADIKAKPGCVEAPTPGELYNEVASAYYSQANYETYNFATAKTLVGVYYSEATTYDPTPDWEGLQTIVNEAHSYPLGEGLGEYRYLNNHGVDMTDGIFKTVLEQIEEDLNGSRVSTYSDVEYYKANLREMIDALSINQPEAGKFYRLKGAHTADTQYYAEFKDGGMKYNSATASAESIIYFEATDEANKFKLLGYASGLYGSRFELATIDGEADTYTFGKMRDKDHGAVIIGQYYFKSTADGKWGHPWNHGYVQTKGTANNDESQYDNYGGWHLEEVTTLPFTIASSGYSTFNSPVATAIPAGVKAYTAKVDITDQNNPVIVYTKVEDVIPANTPVFLAGTAGAAVTFNLDYANDAAALENNDFEGTVAAKALTQTIETNADTYYYVLSGGQFKFATTKINGFRAYLNIALPYSPAASSNFRVIFADEFTTGIEAVGAIPANAEIFDLQGRRVNNVRNGLYIVNGKKVIR